MGNFDRDYNVELALGKIPKCTIFEKFGRNADVDAAEDIWNGGGDYTGFPTGSAEKLEILSSSASDTAAGTGARTVLISGLLDANGVMLSDVTVILNGTTPVALDATQTYSRASRVKVMTGGSGAANAGTLTLRHVVTTTNIFSVMPIGTNRSSMAIYTVPYGHKLLVNRLYASMTILTGSTGSAAMALRARPYGAVFQEFIPAEISSSKSYSICCSAFPLIFEARTDIKWRAESVGQNNTIIEAQFGGTLVKLDT